MNTDTKLRQLRKKTNTKPSDLAASANMTVSNYYKYERGEQPLTAELIEKFAACLRVEQAELLPSHTPTGMSDEGHSYTPPSDHYMASAKTASGLDLWKIDTSHLEMNGIMPGDILLIDSRQGVLDRLETGDIIIAQHYHDDGATTIFRQFIAPALLITNSRKNNLPSLVLDRDNVAIMGVMRSSHRTK